MRSVSRRALASLRKAPSSSLPSSSSIEPAPDSVWKASQSISPAPFSHSPFRPPDPETFSELQHETASKRTSTAQETAPPLLPPARLAGRGKSLALPNTAAVYDFVAAAERAEQHVGRISSLSSASPQTAAQQELELVLQFFQAVSVFLAVAGQDCWCQPYRDMNVDELFLLYSKFLAAKPLEETKSAFLALWSANKAPLAIFFLAMARVVVDDFFSSEKVSRMPVHVFVEDAVRSFFWAGMLQNPPTILSKERTRQLYERYLPSLLVVVDPEDETQLALGNILARKVSARENFSSTMFRHHDQTYKAEFAHSNTLYLRTESEVAGIWELVMQYGESKQSSSSAALFPLQVGMTLQKSTLFSSEHQRFHLTEIINRRIFEPEVTSEKTLTAIIQSYWTLARAMNYNPSSAQALYLFFKSFAAISLLGPNLEDEANWPGLPLQEVAILFPLTWFQDFFYVVITGDSSLRKIIAENKKKLQETKTMAELTRMKE